MDQVAKGNLDQLAPLFERYKRQLYNYFVKMTLDADLSEDLIQTLFMRVIKYKKSYNSSYSFKSWIYRIARNVFNDHYQKKKSYSDSFSLENVTEDISIAEESQELQEKEQILMKAMAQLPEDKRELLILSKFQGMKYEQIAKIREVSVGAIKVQVHRTLNQLKEIYFKHEN